MDESGCVNVPDRDQPLSASVLVLNRNCTAVRIVSARRAFSLLYRKCAEPIDAHDEEWDGLDFQGWMIRSLQRHGSPASQDQFVGTPRFALLPPRPFRLVTTGRVPRCEARFRRRNILARDEHRCQDCNQKLPTSQLSLDPRPAEVPGRESDVDERRDGLHALQHAQGQTHALGSVDEISQTSGGSYEEPHAFRQGRVADLPDLAPLPRRRRNGV